MENLVMSEFTFWKNKKVLITGHTGFKGTWLVIWLMKMGAKVCGYSLKEDENSLFNLVKKDIINELTYKESDILNLSDLKDFVFDNQPDIIIHLAAQSLVRESYINPILTWQVNVIGSLNLLEASKSISKPCSILIITTDKVYENKEIISGYREDDVLGGYDPYSASKAAAEIAIRSWKLSFGSDFLNLNIATARSGNVIGGGDWAKDRIIPDIVRSLKKNQTIFIRNPKSTRPWQHVLEPLKGYLLLAKSIYEGNQNKDFDSFNFGPKIENNKTVEDVVESALQYWPGSWERINKKTNLHEAKLLHLQSDKAFKLLGWKPIWSFEKTIDKTINWYKSVYENCDPYKKCLENIEEFSS